MIIPDVTDPDELREYMWRRAEELYADPAIQKAIDRQETALKTTPPLTTGNAFSHYRGNVFAPLELASLYRDMGNQEKYASFIQQCATHKGEFVAGLGRAAYLTNGTGGYVFEESLLPRDTLGALALAADQTDWTNEQALAEMYEQFKAVRMDDATPDILIG